MLKKNQKEDKKGYCKVLYFSLLLLPHVGFHVLLLFQEYQFVIIQALWSIFSSSIHIASSRSFCAFSCSHRGFVGAPVGRDVGTGSGSGRLSSLFLTFSQRSLSCFLLLLSIPFLLLETFFKLIN
eukprot:TRINITY_DN2191_c1_g1_i8.p1 TRINITY_DN2191_c1_g1~~TRINITY_DN2191_c1_g1_i8.p1  ORF type:complete len:125 (+),score=11.35 TRINITY_DN2191_c1_g1_i8:123-497(+)